MSESPLDYFESEDPKKATKETSSKEEALRNANGFVFAAVGAVFIYWAMYLNNTGVHIVPIFGISLVAYLMSLATATIILLGVLYLLHFILSELGGLANKTKYLLEIFPILSLFTANLAILIIIITVFILNY